MKKPTVLATGWVDRDYLNNYVFLKSVRVNVLQHLPDDIEVHIIKAEGKP